MIKIVRNTCFGGFNLSEKALKFMGITEAEGYEYSFESQRTDPKLVECVETLGKEASGYLSDLEVVEIPDGVDWYITDYDGVERIREGRSW